MPLLERLLQTSKNLIIIADDVDGEALATLAVNKLRGTINVLAVKAPGFGDHRKDNLGDIAVLTGGEVISDELGRKLDSVQLADLGRARRVIATKEEDHDRRGQGRARAPPTPASRRCERAIMEEAKSDWDKEKAQGAAGQARRQRRR